jgi:hypothetical protein
MGRIVGVVWAGEEAREVGDHRLRLVEEEEMACSGDDAQRAAGIIAAIRRAFSRTA